MAGPVAHIVCALAVLQSGFLGQHDSQKIIAGTSWNDVRYRFPAQISREDTHEKGLTWRDIASERDPFRTGMRLHTLLDQAREAYMVAHDAYRFLPEHPLKASLLKFIEDRILYQRVADWQEALKSFDEIDAIERSFGLDDEQIMVWHDLIKSYCSQKPSIEQALAIAGKHDIALGQKAKMMLPLIKMYVQSLEQNEEFCILITHFYDNVVDYLMAYKEDVA